MSEDIRFCPVCSGYFEAGGDSTCTCEDEDDRGDWEYHQAQDQMEFLHAHELINRNGL